MGELDADPAGRLTVEVANDDDGSAIVIVTGDLDMTTTEELEARVDPVIQSSSDRLVVDVSGVGFADSSAIALFVRWASLVREIEIREPSAMLRRVIQRMGLADRLEMSP